MTRSQIRPLLVGAVVLVVAAFTAGCSAAGSSGLAASMTSEQRAEQPSELDGVPSPDPGTLDEELDALDQELQEQLGDLGLDDLEGTSECVEVTLAYGRLFALAFQGPDASAETEAVLDELRAILPPDLADEVQVISDMLSEASQAGFLEVTGLMSDPDFRAANAAIGEWLEAGCGVAGG